MRYGRNSFVSGISKRCLVIVNGVTIVLLIILLLTRNAPWPTSRKQIQSNIERETKNLDYSYSSAKMTINHPNSSSSINQDITFVLLAYFPDYLRVPILLRSLEINIPDSVTYAMKIVVPDPQVFWMKQLRGYKGLSIEIIPENRIFKKPSGMGAYGNQMFLKVAVSNHISTGFYLILDADIIAIRDLRPESLIKDDKARRRNEKLCVNQYWCADSAKVLGIDLTPELKERVRFGVTPAVINTKIMRQVYFTFIRMNDGGTVGDCFKLDWSEYLMYALMLHTRYDPDDYYTWDLPDLYNWAASPEEVQHVIEMDPSERALFMVYQSTFSDEGDMIRIVTRGYLFSPDREEIEW